MQIVGGRSVRGLVLLMLVLLGTKISLAQFFIKRPYQQWSKKEAESMLSDSPWSKEVVLAYVSGSNEARAGIPTNRQMTSVGATGNDQTGAQLTYQVQIRSARFIRQALVRLGTLSPKYEQMTAEQKARVDQNAEQFINAKSDDIVFWVNYSSSVQAQNVDLLRYWQSRTLSSLSNTIWLLIPGAEKVEATYFAPGPDQSFEIRFPRPKQLPADGSMVLEFRHPSNLAGQNGQLVRADFKLKKMIVESTAVY